MKLPLGTPDPSQWKSLRSNKWYRRWIELINQGLSPHKLALSVTCGIGIGMIPIWGVSTIILIWVAYRIRINIPLALFVSYVIAPLQIAMIFPFISLGSQLLGVHCVETLSLNETIRFFDLDMSTMVSTILRALGCGVLGWGLCLAPISFVVYWIAKWLFTRMLRSD